MKLFEESTNEEINEEVMEEIVDEEISEFNSEGFDNYKRVLDFFNENNIELTDEQNEALYMALTENKVNITKSFDNEYERCMQHMLKYKYNPIKQSPSWLDSIRDSTLILKDIYIVLVQRGTR